MALGYHCPVCNRAIGYEGLCWKCRAEKERNEALRLTKAQIQERQNYLIEHVQELGEGEDPAERYFWDCLAYHGVVSEELQRAAVKKKIFYPVELYYQAPEDVRDELIECLMSTDCAKDADHLLLCLAMQGDDKTLETFYELKKHPKKWRQDLYVDADVYAEQGGWTFDEAGRRQIINYDTCYSFEKKNTQDKTAVIGKIREDQCPHCGGKLIDILRLDGTDERLNFLGMNGKVTATCCPNCVMLTEAGYSRFELDGTSEACFPYSNLTEHQENDMSEETYKKLAENGLELSEKERPLFYGADDWEAVTLGGFAHWIVDCTITKCPDCGKPMRYLAQLSWESIMEDSPEGTLYVEICPDCKTASIHYQQT